jgi:YfiH family protein
VRQLHGANVAVVRADGRARQDADIIVSAEAQMALAVRGADCVPLLMADSRGGPIGAAHAGWRGLAARVPYVAVAALADQYGSRPVDLIAAAGPSIGACCYEVGDDVRDSFVQAGFTASELDRWFLIAPQPTPDNPTMPGLGSRRDGHWFFDGWTATRDQLIAAGVAAENIFMSGACTASHPDVFCSYRRDGAGTGRLVGAIRSAESPGQRPSRR